MNQKLQNNFQQDFIRSNKKIKFGYLFSCWICWSPAKNCFFLEILLFAQWIYLHWALYQEYLNIRNLNDLLVLTELFLTPDLLDWRIPYIYIYIYIYIRRNIKVREISPWEHLLHHRPIKCTHLSSQSSVYKMLLAKDRTVCSLLSSGNSSIILNSSYWLNTLIYTGNESSRLLSRCLVIITLLHKLHNLWLTKLHWHAAKSLVNAGKC